MQRATLPCRHMRGHPRAGPLTLPPLAGVFVLAVGAVCVVVLWKHALRCSSLASGLAASAQVLGEKRLIPYRGCIGWRPGYALLV